ncbi:MAG TPA: molybdopterin cofactor-binding domain-containing protein [Usitatibacter sp.]|nr:molybdopterin cofactor-binding domain-containing protein [Usitatibacter sp.]
MSLPMPGRREFLAGGGALVLAFSLSPRAWAQEAHGDAGKGPKLPGSLSKTPLLDSWIRIAADGSITVFTGKCELGQGVRTALQQIAAEQLAVAFERVAMVTADTALTPNEGFTSGSNSLKDSGTAILNAAAQVREILLAEAARRWNAAPGDLSARDGFVTGPGAQRLGYGDLVAGQSLHVQAKPQSPLVPASAHRVMGKAVARVDIPAKVTGGEAYVHDLRLPGMVHARVVRPPQPGATLRSLGTAPAAAMPGVLKIVHDGSFVAVVAEKEFQAVQAMRALQDRAQWDSPPMPPADIHAHLASLGSDDTVILDRTGQGGGGTSHEAAYRRPYHLHGAIGPACAVALFKDGELTVWSHAQGMFPLRDAVAELVGLPKEKVRCIHREGSGCYGHNGADDAGGDAALIARGFPNRPVRVQWMREQEHSWEPFGPAMYSRSRATLDSGGNIASWEYDVWSNTHSTRPGNAGSLAAGMLVAKPFKPPPPRPIPQPEGGGDRNAIPIYRVPVARVTSHFIPRMPLRVSALRALGAYMNVFSLESFMDELSLLARADPVEFRLRHLDDPRAVDVVRSSARGFGWDAWKRTPGHGRGFAFARYKNLAAYCAVAMEVEVIRESGEIRVGRVHCAIDSGEAVNPDGIRNQAEGGVVQSLSWTLREAVTWDEKKITSRDWGRYPMIRFPHVPRSIDVEVLDRPGQPFLGTGEATQGPAAAALANALCDAAGVRIRDIPFTADRLKAVFRS